VSICEQLRQSDAAANCGQAAGNPAPLDSDPSKTVDQGTDAARNVGNPFLMCAHCHNGSDPNAPIIPFGNAARLEQELRAPGSKLKQKIIDEVTGHNMPPGGGLKNKDDIDAIKRYLERQKQ
jgi:cytochrome c5